MWRRYRPLPPLRRVPFVLAKGTRTARSSIRPYAALRVPSLRCLPGASRPTTRYAKSTSRDFGLGRRGLRTSSLQTPTLSLLKSRSYGRRLHGRICEIKVWRSHTDAEATADLLDLDLDVHARTSRRRQRRLQEAERRCLKGHSAAAEDARRRLGVASRRPRRPGGCRSEGTRSAA